MEDDLIIGIVSCEHCGNQFQTQKFCSTCSFPIGGTDYEKQQFRSAVSSRKRLLKEAEEKMKTAKNIIYVLAGLFFIIGLYHGIANEDYITMIVNLFVCVLYLILAAWSRYNPFGAILTAFILYITLNVVNAFFDPITLVQGILWKIIFIGAFIKGIRSAQEAQNHINELSKVKAAPIGDF